MNDLTAIDPIEQQRLKEKMGIETNTSADRVPMLKVNLDFEDDAGNELKPGTIYLKDHEPTVYAKEFKLRVLGHHYQYIEYSPELKKTVCKTTINKSFNQDFLDTRGSTKCGMTKPKSKMDEYEKERFKNVTCFRMVRGLVSFEGTDASGNTHHVENQPVILMLKGSNFMPYDEEVVRKLPKGTSAWDYWLNVKLERRKNGSVTYYVYHYDFDPAATLPLDQRTADTIKVFSEMVDRENSRIMESHYKAIEERNSGAYEPAEDDSLDADFE